MFRCCKREELGNVFFDHVVARDEIIVMTMPEAKNFYKIDENTDKI